jgi:hypothetical protein
LDLKQDPTIYCLQEKPLTGKDKQVESERVGRITIDGAEKHAGVAVFIFDKSDFKPKLEEAKIISYW